MANTFDLIASTTIATAVADYTFTSIPATYKDLVLKISARSTANGGQNCNLTFNSNTSGYADLILGGTGSGSAASFTSGNTARGGSVVIPGADFTASVFGNGTIYIVNYAGNLGTKFFSNDSVSENNATLSYQQLEATTWGNSAAISSIKIDLSGGNFAVNSTFYLYGVKNV
jgi:hypothetical protein